eukprot:TRINITY_DN837_c0_g1_i2.p1 TRINITY_DN837_c0_g1~~TRINITY_DN837_c0_g1_i2.p1  ORF type:complete len:143 (+),score=36.39 TRINITY_DN837_c0_g1_i2:173-601(+)
MNKVMLIGNVGADPQPLSETNPNTSTFNLATSDIWTDKNTGEKRSNTEWHRIVIFNENKANYANNYIKKGYKVFVEGEIKTSNWTTETGEKRYRTQIQIGNFRGDIGFISRPRSHEENNYEPRGEFDDGNHFQDWEEEPENK